MGLWQTALIFQFSAMESLPSAWQLKFSILDVCVCARALHACACIWTNTHAQTFDFLGKSKGNCWPRVRHLSEALNLYGHFPLHAAATVIICQQQFAKLHGGLSNLVIYYSKLHLDRIGKQRTWQRFPEVCHGCNENMHRIKENEKCAFCFLVTNVSTCVCVWSGFAQNTSNAIFFSFIFIFFSFCMSGNLRWIKYENSSFSVPV